jgi:hypothetical protein
MSTLVRVSCGVSHQVNEADAPRDRLVMKAVAQGFKHEHA